MGLLSKDRFRDLRRELVLGKKEKEAEERILGSLTGSIRRKKQLESEKQRTESELVRIKSEWEASDERARVLRHQYDNFDSSFHGSVLVLVERRSRLLYELGQQEQHIGELQRIQIDGGDPSHADDVSGAIREAEQEAERMKEELQQFEKDHPQIEHYKRRFNELSKETRSESVKSRHLLRELEKYNTAVSILTRSLGDLDAKILKLLSQLFKEEYLQEKDMVDIERTVESMHSKL